MFVYFEYECKLLLLLLLFLLVFTCVAHIQHSFFSQLAISFEAVGDFRFISSRYFLKWHNMVYFFPNLTFLLKIAFYILYIPDTFW